MIGTCGLCGSEGVEVAVVDAGKPGDGLACMGCLVKTNESLTLMVQQFAPSQLMMLMQAMGQRCNLTAYAASMGFYELIREGGGIIAYRAMVGTQPAIPSDDEITMLKSVAGLANGWWVCLRGTDKFKWKSFAPKADADHPDAPAPEGQH